MKKGLDENKVAVYPYGRIYGNKIKPSKSF